MLVNLVQFTFSVKVNVCLAFVLIHIMLSQGCDVSTVDYLAVAVELKVARPIAYPLTQTLGVAYEHNQAYVYFILKLLIRITEPCFEIPLS